MNIFNSLVTYKDSVYHADGIRCWSNKQIIIKAKRKKTAEELYCEHFASKFENIFNSMPHDTEENTLVHYDKLKEKQKPMILFRRQKNCSMILMLLPEHSRM